MDGDASANGLREEQQLPALVPPPPPDPPPTAAPPVCRSREKTKRVFFLITVCISDAAGEVGNSAQI